MGDQADIWRERKARRRERRAQLGVNCPGCPAVRPKAHPTILMPGQKCKVCGHVDRRKT